MRPLVTPLLSFLVGIVVSERLALSWGVVSFLLAASIAATVLCWMRGFGFRGALLVPVFFSLGALFIIPRLSPLLPPEHVKGFMENPAGFRVPSDVVGSVLTRPETREGRTRFNVEAQKIFHEGEWRDTVGKIRLTVEGDAGELSQGDAIRFIAYLREPRNFGNPGEFDYTGRLNLDGIFTTGFVKDSAFVVRLGEGEAGGRGLAGQAPPARFTERARRSITGFIEREGLVNAGVIKALITGERSGIDQEVTEAFRKTGASHVLAISGLHVGMAAFFSYALFLFLLKRSSYLTLAVNVKKTALALALVPVGFYGALAGFPLSTQRAVVMAFAFVLAMLINRGRDFINTLALAAFAILVMEPQAVWEVSFQLTFTAVFFIVYLLPRFNGFIERSEGDPLVKAFENRWIRRFKRWPVSVFFVTLAASLGVSPIIAYHFHMVSTVGLLANVIVVPLTGLLVPLLLVSTALTPLLEGLSSELFHLADFLAGIMVLVVRFFSEAPFSSVWVSRPTFFEIFLYYALVISAANIKKVWIYRFLTPALVILILLDQGWWSMEKRFRDELKVTFISVGQGDSALVEFPGGGTMLIDGGGLYSDFDTGERIIAPLLWYKKIKKIDYMVLSHAQRDHMEGLKFIAGNFCVGEFWWNGYRGGGGGGAGELGGLGEILRRKEIPVRVVGAGTEEVRINGVTVEALHPARDYGFDVNNMSLVLRLAYGERSFLFTGDIGPEAEEMISSDIPSSTVMKSPHHGSRRSSSSGFLEGVDPELVVISVGRGNSFGFPHAESLENYNNVGARVLRTDINGAVEVRTDGKRLEVTTYGLRH